jgi:DNA topoisomerase 2-associated protein PAT1
LLSQQNLQHMPQSIQMQQRLLSEMAQAEFVRDLQGASAVEQEALRMEAMRKIMEAERMEEKRRRRAAKIAYMVIPQYFPLRIPVLILAFCSRGTMTS